MSKISLITLNLFRDKGDRLVLGGLERYTKDLAFLCRELGYEVDIHQHGTHDWENNLDGIPVYGYGVSQKNPFETAKEANKNSSKNVIYTWLGQQNKKEDYKPNSITISHGIWFDQSSSNLSLIKNFVINASEGCKYVVSVDTNYLCFVRATYPKHSKNIRYIPNYADISIFYPSEENNSDRITILYPRRIDKVRGIDTAKKVCNHVLEKYNYVDFIFAIDNNHDNLWKDFENWVKKNPNKDRITYGNYSYNDIADIYRKADIVVLPSLACEGTSLSGLEAIASGNAVVTTNVGGLNDIFIDNFNGLVVHPNQYNAFLDAVCYLIESPETRKCLKKNAYETSKAFTKEAWKDKWTELIKNTFKE